MRYGRVPGVPKDVSRVVMGTVRVVPAVWEEFVERGGTCFDTARHYGDGSEGELGAFLERSGDRGRLVVVGKGCHTPYTAPEHVGSHLDRSLELLRTDHVDLFLLHRDDPAVPAGEFVDAVNREIAAGRARAAGVSNWAPGRVEEFDAYAAAHGLAGAAAVSNQLSLAEMVVPVWDGCVSAFDPDARAWLERARTPLLAWSPQARGFFSGRGEDEEVRTSWLTAENTARRGRAERLAERLGVAPVSVALAWVLHQPFETFAVVGPRDVAELEACLAALDVVLPAGALAALESGP